MLPLLAACAGDDEEDDPTATVEESSAMTTPEDSESESEADTTPEVEPTTEAASTPEMDATEEADTTPETDMTAETDMTPETDMTAESTPEMDSTPDTDMTAETTPDMDSTPEVDATTDTGMGDGPFGELGELSADVPNFTMEFSGVYDNVPDDLGDLYSAEFELMLMQSEPDVYHLSMVTSGDETFNVELWALPDATYIAEEGGEPLELPAGTAGEIVPTDALTILPDLQLLENAEEVGESEVDGRTATEYRVDAEDAVVILMASGQDVNISNPDGEMRVWVDEELGIVTQLTSDITFENEDGSEGSIDAEYIVTDIDETEDIEAPGSN